MYKKMISLTAIMAMIVTLVMPARRLDLTANRR